MDGADSMPKQRAALNRLDGSWLSPNGVASIAFVSPGTGVASRAKNLQQTRLGLKLARQQVAGRKQLSSHCYRVGQYSWQHGCSGKRCRGQHDGGGITGTGSHLRGWKSSRRSTGASHWHSSPGC